MDEIRFSVPPMPTPTTARSDANAIKLGEPPAARPEMPASNRVMLKHHLTNKSKIHFFLQPRVRDSITSYRLPQISQPKPQNTAPTSKPTLAAKIKNGALKVNSSLTETRIRLVVDYLEIQGRNIIYKKNTGN
jgi:hypothetical protein